MHSFALDSPSLQASCRALFWLAASAIAYTYAGYPLLLRLLASLVRRPSPEPATHVHITLLICAHDEAGSIEAKLQNSLSLDYPAQKLQILVVSDGSTDETNRIVASFADRGVELVCVETQAGKTNAQNIAMAHARGEIVVFSDATTHYNPDALRYIAGNYRDPRVGACSGRYLYLDPTHTSPSGAGAGAYARYDNAVRQLQSQIWSVTGCCGCIYSIRRALYTPLAKGIISDLVQPMHILKQGFRVTLEPRAIACEKATSSTKREFSMRVRVVARALFGLWSVHDLLVPWLSPWIAFQLWSHKLLRWLVPFFLVALLASTFLLRSSTFFAAALLLQLAFYTVALIVLLLPPALRWRPLSLPLYFCTLNAAAAAGVFQFLRGNRYVHWTPDREEADGTS